MNIFKLQILDNSGGVVAYLYPDEQLWRDPFGGTFSDEGQSQFGTVARGHERDVTLHGGRFDVRLAVVEDNKGLATVFAAVFK